MSASTQHKFRTLYAALLIALLLLFTVAYNRRAISTYLYPGRVPTDTTANAHRAQLDWNKVRADSATRFVKNGDLVLRAGSDAISGLFKRINTRDKSWSHAGIVFWENGYPFVYNCTGTAAEPHALLKRDSLIAFVDPYYNTGYAIYRYDFYGNQIDKLHVIAVRYFKEKRTFDPDFDLQTDTALYCTEFVYKAIVETTGDKKYFRTTHTAHFNFVSVDNLFSRSDVRLICKVGYMQ
jgi:hypothetical protein